MAEVIVRIKIMPETPESDLGLVQREAERKIVDFGGQVGKSEREPLAFGLEALVIIFIMDEAKGTTEPLEIVLSQIKGVASVDVEDIRRAVG